DLDAALLADDAAVLHALVLAADALVVLHWPENLRAEETIPLRLEGPVVDGLRLFDLAVRPLADLLGARERDPHRGKAQRVFRLLEERKNVTHGFGSPFGSREKNQLGRTHRSHHSSAAAWPAVSTSSTLRQSDCSSLMRTLKLSGRPASSVYSP